MIFTELPPKTQEAMAYILGKYTTVTENGYNRMSEKDQKLWQMFCFFIADISNKRDEKSQKDDAEKFLKKLQ